MNKKWLAAIATVYIVLAGCAAEMGAEDGAIVATPDLPAYLQELPTQGYAQCRGDPVLDSGSIYLWELPGLPPTDKNSGYIGRRGRVLGELDPCASVTITEVSWSEVDQEFWLLIESEHAKGWVTLDLIQFEDAYGQTSSH